MSRSGYSDDCWGSEIELYRQAVWNGIHGKRGQAFLRELIAALDAMPVKQLVANELQTSEGAVCAMGAVARARGMDVSKLNPDDRDLVGKTMNIAPSMAAEISYINDDDFDFYGRGKDTPETRFERVYNWAKKNLVAK